MNIEGEAFRDLKVADSKGRILLGSRYAGKRFAIRHERDGSTVLTPVLVVPESESGDIITPRTLTERFAALDSVRDNWDGRGSQTPLPELVRHAREVTGLLQASTLARGVRWIEPHIGSNERGEISLEWWHAERSLTVYVRSTERIDYLKTWGSDIVNEMEDGEVKLIGDYISLAHWLYGEQTKAA